MSLPESTLSWLGMMRATSATTFLTTVYTFSVMACHLMYYSSSDISKDVGFGDAECSKRSPADNSSSIDDSNLNCTSLKSKDICELHSEVGCIWNSLGSGFDVQFLSGLGYAITYAVSSIILVFSLNSSKLANVNRVYCICIASLLTTLSLAGMAFSESYWQLLCLRLFMGFSSSIITPMVSSVVVSHFRKTRLMTLMTSVVGFGVYFGGGLANTILKYFESNDAWSVFGRSPWRSAYLVTCIPSVMSIFFALLFVREASWIIDDCETEVSVSTPEGNSSTATEHNIEIVVISKNKDLLDEKNEQVEEGMSSDKTEDDEVCCDVEQQKLIPSQMDNKSDNISILSKISNYSSNVKFFSSITTLTSLGQTSKILTRATVSSDVISGTMTAPTHTTDESFVGMLRNVVLKDRTFVSLVVAVGIRNMGPCVWLYNVKSFYLNHNDGGYQIGDLYTTVLTVAGPISLAVTGLMGDCFLTRFGKSSFLWILTSTSFAVVPFCFLAVILEPSTSILMFGVNLLMGEGWLIIFFAYVSEKFDDHRMRSSAFAVVICSIEICGGLFPLVYEWLNRVIGPSQAMYICFPGMNTVASILFLMISVSNHNKMDVKCSSELEQSNGVSCSVQASHSSTSTIDSMLDKTTTTKLTTSQSG